jgi:hypothetical protein
VAQARAEHDPFELWPEHRDAVAVFARCTTQWSVLIGGGGLSELFVHHEGLDYEKVACVARDWLRIDLSPRLLDQVRVMEDEAKKLLNR